MANMSLTRREVEVARLAAEGMTCREIAADLGIGFTTVRTHLQNVYHKCGVRNRLQMERHLRDIG